MNYSCEVLCVHIYTCIYYIYIYTYIYIYIYIYIYTHTHTHIHTHTYIYIERQRPYCAGAGTCASEFPGRVCPVQGLEFSVQSFDFKGGKEKKKRKSSYHGFEELGMKLRLPRCGKEHNHLARKKKKSAPQLLTSLPTHSTYTSTVWQLCILLQEAHAENLWC